MGNEAGEREINVKCASFTLLFYIISRMPTLYNCICLYNYVFVVKFVVGVTWEKRVTLHVHCLSWRMGIGDRDACESDVLRQYIRFKPRVVNYYFWPCQGGTLILIFNISMCTCIYNELMDDWWRTCVCMTELYMRGWYMSCVAVPALDYCLVLIQQVKSKWLTTMIIGNSF